MNLLNNKYKKDNDQDKNMSKGRGKYENVMKKYKRETKRGKNLQFYFL